ncbi:MotE family protein [Salinarimonas chemoclinalis]|uniref:MotE family protein n=1 Tax=Salinarimonas chemoclinalis TaxID=3241599 RepID=UPI003555FE3C
MRHPRRRLPLAVALGASLLAAPSATALEAAPDAVPAAPPPADVALYCEAIREEAQEARARWQARALLEIEARIEARLADLEALRVEVEEALARREEHLRQAEEGIVAIYARMRPDAAAAQLAALENEMASAVLAKLAPRQASAILNEMEPGRAAQLARTAAETARTDADQEQSL